MWETLRRLRHENVVRFYERFEPPDMACTVIVMELLGGGNLFQYVLSHTDLVFHERHAAAALGQVLQAVAYLHRNDIVGGPPVEYWLQSLTTRR